MKQDLFSIERAVSAAVGDDGALMSELRAVFFESAVRHALDLAQARDGSSWREAAWRLKGCAASFGAIDLMAAATGAAERPARDAAALASIARALDALAG